MARKKELFPQNTVVHTVIKLGGPLEIRHGSFSQSDDTPNADYPTQYALNEHMAELWRKHERKYRKRFAAGENVETQFFVMDKHPERTAQKGLHFVLTTNYHDPGKEV